MIFLNDHITPSPLQVIEDERLRKANVHLFLKRDDLLHNSYKEILFGDSEILKLISGNKFQKLKYNLLFMKQEGFKRLLTFGGAFSNHIHAVAAAGQFYGIETIGVIRGERLAALNPTLRFAERCGMVLHFINRSDYRDKDLIINELKAQFGAFYYLPEGGTNALAMRGTAEIVGEIQQQMNGVLPDFISVACGTGGTVTGIISATEPPTQVLGFSALKGDFLQKDVKNLLETLKNASNTEGVHDFGFRISDVGSSSAEIRNPISEIENTEGSLFSENTPNWSINTDFHFGGYARWTPELIDFINDFKQKHGVQLDPIYTGKMLFGIFKLVEMGFFPPNSSIVAIHTGGLQGIEGFNQRFGELIGK